MRFATTIALTAAAAVLTLGACGDDDSPEATADPGTETPAADTNDGTGSTDDDAGAAETVTVQIPEFAFDPTPIEVAVGGSVVWENTHTQPHTSSGNGDQDWDTGPIQPGESSEAVTFDEAGTFSYICGLHPFMEGTVEVSA